MGTFYMLVGVKIHTTSLVGGNFAISIEEQSTNIL